MSVLLKSRNRYQHGMYAEVLFLLCILLFVPSQLRLNDRKCGYEFLLLPFSWSMQLTSSPPDGMIYALRFVSQFHHPPTVHPTRDVLFRRCLSEHLYVLTF